MIPPLRFFNRPFLEILSDNKIWSRTDIQTELIKRLGLNGNDLAERTKSGIYTKFYDRISWSIAYLKRAGLIKAKSKGLYVITDLGRTVLNAEEQDCVLDNKVLSKYSSDFDTFQNNWRRKNTSNK